MYTIKDVCHTGILENPCEIKDVKAIDGRRLLLTFRNNEKRVFDTSLLKGSAFAALRDPDAFKSVNIENGVVTWLNGDLDCAPEYMYRYSEKY